MKYVKLGRSLAVLILPRYSYRWREILKGVLQYLHSAAERMTFSPHTEQVLLDSTK